MTGLRSSHTPSIRHASRLSEDCHCHTVSVNQLFGHRPVKLSVLTTAAATVAATAATAGVAAAASTAAYVIS